MKVWDDSGLSEVVDSTLIVALGIVLAIVIAVFVFGVFVPVDKTAYVVPRFGISNDPGRSFVTIFNRGGDPVGFLNQSPAKYRADVYLDTAIGTFRAVPDPGLPVFRPGDTVYLFYTGSGFLLTNDSATAYSPLPGGRLSIRLVDATSGVLIAAEDLVPGPVPSGATPTATTAATITPTATGTTPTVLPTTLATTTTVTPTTVPSTTQTTTTQTTTVTTTATTTPIPTTATPTPTPATHTITVSWSPWGLGTVSPPGGNSGAVVAITVPHGSSQVFVATPVQHKAVRSIVVDGSAIYAGSSAGTPVTFTFSNIVSSHTVAVSFG